MREVCVGQVSLKQSKTIMVEFFVFTDVALV